jgi:hypothetical protein
LRQARLLAGQRYGDWVAPPRLRHVDRAGGEKAFCASWRLPPAVHIDGAGPIGRLLADALKSDLLEGESGCDVQRVLTRERLPSPDRHVDIAGIDLQPVAPTSNPLRCQKRRAGPAKRVENDLVAPGTVLHRVGDHRRRLDRGVSTQIVHAARPKGAPERFFSFPYGGSYLKRAKRAFGNPYVNPYYGSYYAPQYYYGNYRSPYYW